MKVTLIDYTGKGNPDPDHAINILIFTKQTRLTMTPGLLDEIAAWPALKKVKELEYMANTIPSSWEMCHYTWMVEGVSRGFTHQFVRSRQFSFAQQTMRVLDVSTGPGWDYHTGPSIPTEKRLEEILNGAPMIDHNEFTRGRDYHDTMKTIAERYKVQIHQGAAIEDARGILPTNILTNIVGSCNMRTFVELVRKRSSPRTQSEYRDVLDAMKASVREVHPWIDLFIDRTFDRAANDLCSEIKASDLPESGKTKLIKLVDQMRAQS